MMKMRPARVRIEGDERLFDALVTGQLWDGYCECPFFTKEEGLEIAQVLDVLYDSERDVFVTPSFEWDWDTVEVDGVKYHGIGARAWEWILETKENEEGKFVEIDPWAGDFSRGAWVLMSALIRVMKYEVKVGESLVFSMMLSAENACQDEALLRKILTDAVAEIERYEIEISDEIRSDLDIIVAGGNPWED